MATYEVAGGRAMIRNQLEIWPKFGSGTAGSGMAAGRGAFGCRTLAKT
ncbi:hypothetical protein AKJ09_02934 [Labilithrix luteola]|uniref:Uncharacterized protein n=1 Tax=Labilithrix luteola TaxID=1391654 RepID=A0A0K1PRV7_9BACT|nr:hypothetical protein AKJ09_02934 [Labilithrix luteola]